MFIVLSAWITEPSKEMEIFLGVLGKERQLTKHKMKRIRKYRNTVMIAAFLPLFGKEINQPSVSSQDINHNFKHEIEEWDTPQQQKEGYYSSKIKK